MFAWTAKTVNKIVLLGLCLVSPQDGLCEQTSFTTCVSGLPTNPVNSNTHTFIQNTFHTFPVN